MIRQTIPLSRRPGDIAILAFLFINILFIPYIVDIERLIIPDPAHFYSSRTAARDDEDGEQ